MSKARQLGPVLLGIDVGTSSVKALLWPVDGSAPPRVARAPLRSRRGSAGASEMDCRAWWRAVVRAVGRVEVSGAEVLGLGVSTVFPALVAMDARGRALRPAILYDDRRSVAQVETFRRQAAAQDGRAAGNRLLPGTISLSSLLWLRDNEPRLFSKARWFGHAGTYLGRRLTGRVALDATNASLTGLYAASGSGWLAEACATAGVAPERLPEVVWPAETLGGLSRRAAQALGLQAGIPVAAGAGDSACGALALGLVSPDELVATCGSTDSLIALLETPTFDESTVNLPYMDGGTWLAIAPMNASGAAVSWFSEVLFGSGRRRFDRFFAAAARAPVASGGTVFLPYLAGERSPVFDPTARGVFFGLSLATGRAEMARAVLEGVAFGHREILSMLEARFGRRVARVVAAGGGTADRLWRQIRADATERPYRYADVPDASALGAALLGGVAGGVFGSWREAASEASHRVRFDEVRPDRGAWERLKPNFDVYARLYEAVRECF